MRTSGVSAAGRSSTTVFSLAIMNQEKSVLLDVAGSVQAGPPPPSREVSSLIAQTCSQETEPEHVIVFTPRHPAYSTKSSVSLPGAVICVASAISSSPQPAAPRSPLHGISSPSFSQETCVCHLIPSLPPVEVWLESTVVDFSQANAADR